MSARRFVFYLSLAFLIVLVIGIPIRSQYARTQQNSGLIVGRNVNMVHGIQLPGGDPYLQRQNEPSIAASTRNPMHLLAGANDYRTIDMPFEDQVPNQEVGQQAIGRDAWLGVFKSFDGGQSWISTLLPGFPQDSSYSPLKAFGTAADPVVRAGTNGLFYYAGIAFNRVDRGSGVVFVARYIDLNNQENADTIKYDGVSIVDQGNAGQFLDKPWMAVDIPRPGHGHTTFPGQDEEVPCGNVYVAYSAFVGKTDVNIRSKILFARSVDCGRTWSAPIKLSETQHLDQGTTIAIDPNTGAIYVAWRRFSTASQINAIIFAKSTDGGLTFTRPVVVRTLALSFPASPAGPFDQRTTAASFRTNSHPTIAADHNGTVYLAWAERNSGKMSRILLIYSKDSGTTWSPSSPVTVDNTGTGHQFMPSLTYAGGKLMLTWYDQRNDISSNTSDFIEDSPNSIRHTVDVRAAQIDPVNSSNSTPFIHDSQQVSRYLFLLEGFDNAGDPILTQAQHNFTGLDMFQKGTVPFLGDYIDITPAPVFLPAANGEWRYNTDLNDPADPTKQLLTAYHVAWEDTRDVRFPPGTGLWPNWGDYKAPISNQPDPFPDPSDAQSCDFKGMMNQNVYTACVSKGFIASSPGNTKPLNLEGNPTDTHGWPIARAFTVTVKNITDVDKSFRLTIEAPNDVTASFVQYFDIDPNATYPNFPQGFPVILADVVVAAQSSISRPVFVYPSSNSMASVKVHVTEETTSLASIVTLNPDPTTPIIQDPTIKPGMPPEPNIKGRELHTPNIKGDNIKYPNIKGNSLITPNIKGNDVINSDTASPNIKGNPLNPNIKGSDLLTPNIKGDALSEITWEVTNEGNTTTPYIFDIYTDYTPPNTTDSNAPNYVPPDEAIQFQLLIYRVYLTPTAPGCNLTTEEHHELLANIPNPNIKGPNIKGSTMSARTLQAEDAKTPTFWLNPGEKALVTLWAYDPKLDNGDDFEFGDPGTDFSQVKTQAATTSLAHNTEDLDNGIYELPTSATIPLGILNDTLDNATVGVPYSDTLMAIGDHPPFTWSVISGALPTGLQLDSNTGVISGTPTIGGLYSFTIEVKDSESPQQTASKPFSIQITLGAPIQISPADGSQWVHYPRTTVLQWQAVPGAVSYSIDREWWEPVNGAWEPYTIVTGITTTSYTFDFIGDQPGRWRVWAVGAGGYEGPKSGWWTFSYNTNPPLQLSPPNGSVFSNFPRNTTVTWSAIPGAASYTVEWQFYDPINNVWSGSIFERGNTGLSCTFNFVGAQPGRWRVCAVSSNGLEGPMSVWWGFSYTI